MIRRTLENLWLGLQQLRYNTHYLLVVVLLIVLPGLFVWVSQQSFDAAYQNINTAEKQAVSLVHDSLEILLLQGNNTALQNYVTTISTADNAIGKVRILQQTPAGLLITFSNENPEIGLNEGASELYVTSATVPGETLIFDLTINDVRTWQAFRQIKTENETFYIFTEHSFGAIDPVMLSRQQQTYLALSAIFIFLMWLAYWLYQQTNWHKKFIVTKQRLDEQMMFTNSVAHELRAPLTAIRGYLSFLLESNNLSSEEKSYAQNVDISANRLIALINDFLEVARIQSGKLKLNFQPTDIREVLEKTRIEFEPIANDKGLTLEVNVPGKPVKADTDTARLQQVLTNLVSNALKYTDSGSVKIHLEQTKLKTIIRIKDTGHGISAEDQRKLFGAFTRVGSAEAGKSTGTGLGMWITKQLVELLHGTVAVESIEGVGTHVKLTFDV